MTWQKINFTSCYLTAFDIMELRKRKQATTDNTWRGNPPILPLRRYTLPDYAWDNGWGNRQAPGNEQTEQTEPIDLEPAIVYPLPVDLTEREYVPMSFEAINYLFDSLKLVPVTQNCLTRQWYMSQSKPTYNQILIKDTFYQRIKFGLQEVHIQPVLGFSSWQELELFLLHANEARIDGSIKPLYDMQKDWHFTKENLQF